MVNCITVDACDEDTLCPESKVVVVNVETVLIQVNGNRLHRESSHV